MAGTQPYKPAKNSKAVKDAEKMWHNFVTASKYSGIVIAVTLVLMALFLV